MIKYCFFFVLISVWVISFYYHFMSALRPKLMIAFEGPGHVRDFERRFDTHGAELWVFTERKRRYGRLRVGQRPFQTFRRSRYSKMLLVKHIAPVPYHMKIASVVEYKSGNKTVATLWPRLKVWPPRKETDPLQWYRNAGGHITTIII